MFLTSDTCEEAVSSLWSKEAVSSGEPRNAG